MKQSEEYLLKPVNSQREVDFYEFMKITRDPELEDLKHYIPKYNGTAVFKLDDEGEKDIIRE
jgi:hypothetical protein